MTNHRPGDKSDEIVVDFYVKSATHCTALNFLHSQTMGGMNDLLGHLPFVRCYLDDVLIVTKKDWADHVEAIRTVLDIMNSAGLKVNAEKSFFGRSELSYLGYHVSREGVRPDTKKVEAIKALRPPLTRKELRSFIGMVNFYRDMWKSRSHLLAPLTKLMSENLKFEWTEVEQKAFDEVKRTISAESLLTYPDFSIPFDVYTDASREMWPSVITTPMSPHPSEVGSDAVSLSMRPSRHTEPLLQRPCVHTTRI